ncbi:methylated-DNA--[protein]-cysteine S-methyltransferase [Streptomyces cavernae]|uniref:methylated-DNA--[protein]-cysteine S-methyltransferase n=1 Tax=Streptomyces cavernae TaxID=2259034 RepID=UPI000FEBC46A|nr:methylated-DNA--[protein]-cysteine S-methyltransferase [Streptomyces cavernae]
MSGARGAISGASGSGTVWATTDSPVGELLLVGTERADGIALTSLSMPGQRNAPAVRGAWRRDEAAFGEVRRQLSAYFTDQGTEFQLKFGKSGSEFQRRVWAALEEIPYGTTTTYGELAERLGIPRSGIRAVGTAVGANPLLLVRPCHRVVGADGAMCGYAGGVDRKVWLLTHEGALQPTLV